MSPSRTPASVPGRVTETHTPRRNQDVTKIRFRENTTYIKILANSELGLAHRRSFQCISVKLVSEARRNDIVAHYCSRILLNYPQPKGLFRV
eukprot:57459-Prorocentrum_minimum.AAC.2